jgi:hypothetical protein
MFISEGHNKVMRMFIDAGADVNDGAKYIGIACTWH